MNRQRSGSFRNGPTRSDSIKGSNKEIGGNNRLLRPTVSSDLQHFHLALGTTTEQGLFSYMKGAMGFGSRDSLPRSSLLKPNGPSFKDTSATGRIRSGSFRQRRPSSGSAQLPVPPVERRRAHSNADIPPSLPIAIDSSSRTRSRASSNVDVSSRRHSGDEESVFGVLARVGMPTHVH